MRWAGVCFSQLNYPNTPTFKREVEEWRGFLGRYGVTGKMQTTRIGELSEGQKSRIVFAMLCMSRPNMVRTTSAGLVLSGAGIPMPQKPPLQRILQILRSSHQKHHSSRFLCLPCNACCLYVGPRGHHLGFVSHNPACMSHQATRISCLGALPPA